MKRSSRTSVLAAQVALLLAFVLGGCSQKRESKLEAEKRLELTGKAMQWAGMKE